MPARASRVRTPGSGRVGVLLGVLIILAVLPAL